MSYYLFWLGIALAYVGIAYVAYHTLTNRKHTRNNTTRIGKLEISLEELWHIIHHNKKDK